MEFRRLVSRDAKRAGRSRTTAGPAADQTTTADLVTLREETAGMAATHLVANVPSAGWQPQAAVLALQREGIAGAAVTPFVIADLVQLPAGTAGTVLPQTINVGQAPINRRKLFETDIFNFEYH